MSLSKDNDGQISLHKRCNRNNEKFLVGGIYDIHYNTLTLGYEFYRPHYIFVEAF